MTLSYCTNVHPAEDLRGVLAQLDRYAVPVRDRVGGELGLGLWLSAPVAKALAEDPARRAGLRTALDARGLVVRTLNAFPHGGFHDEVVKHAVYHPDWTTTARLDYTLDCATVLADLVPEGGAGSISTLPLAWRHPWSEADHARALDVLAEAAAGLRALADGTGRTIRLAVEPEPGCVVDTVADAVRVLAGRVDPDHVGICLDTCHLAVSFADPAAAVRSIADAGLRVVKVQASAALELTDPADAPAVLGPFAEPRYLHQVRALVDGRVHRADDLPEAFAELPTGGPWRVHFHVPLHAEPPAPLRAEPPAPLRATTDVLREAVAAVREVGHDPDVEVETYTWSVLPDAGERGTGDLAEWDLVEGIAAELRWAAAELPLEVRS
ncbi:metabolite traffic protein EboE [Saccharothrix longispora]|uniref:metabolite traffic protein EboE n=1 Tax=Saccharothrix longispora TaxID=33920 RepID=UPI0028FD6ED9|nr:metabolite traffic protein EboE [Saccharothrix longispora]MBY8847586.1 metabolite traffic protein EboE [Saccharothrix sp. MB29]MDU0294396.1 metabolite traffic protein EboE [Saccharothrix longispora]